jgi:quercetin dioxygenase-like cupin family protein
MPTMDRRTLLCAFGIASISPLMPVNAAQLGKVTVAKPGESLFPFSTASQARLSPCKLTSEISGGSCSAFELSANPQSGPYLHVHHSLDEWYYVLSGEFLFKAGGESHTLPIGASIWLPRGVPHVWANTSAKEAKLALICLPGGFEKFFEEMGSTMAATTAASAQQKMKEVMARHDMELLGPPIFKPLRDPAH